MKMSWYSVCSLLFCVFVCLEPMVRKDTWMKTISVTVRVIFSKMAFLKLLFRSHVQSSFSTIYQAHWQQHFERHLAVKILRAWNNIHKDLSKLKSTKLPGNICCTKTSCTKSLAWSSKSIAPKINHISLIFCISLSF